MAWYGMAIHYPIAQKTVDIFHCHAHALTCRPVKISLIICFVNSFQGKKEFWKSAHKQKSWYWPALSACQFSRFSQFSPIVRWKNGHMHREYFCFVLVHAHSRMARIFMDLQQEVVLLPRKITSLKNKLLWNLKASVLTLFCIRAGMDEWIECLGFPLRPGFESTHELFLKC